jgi:hypothetical protein
MKCINCPKGQITTGNNYVCNACAQKDELCLGPHQFPAMNPEIKKIIQKYYLDTRDALITLLERSEEKFKNSIRKKIHFLEQQSAGIEKIQPIQEIRLNVNLFNRDKEHIEYIKIILESKLVQKASNNWFVRKITELYTAIEKLSTKQKLTEGDGSQARAYKWIAEQYYFGFIQDNPSLFQEEEVSPSHVSLRGFPSTPLNPPGSFASAASAASGYPSALNPFIAPSPAQAAYASIDEAEPGSPEYNVLHRQSAPAIQGAWNAVSYKFLFYEKYSDKFIGEAPQSTAPQGQKEAHNCLIYSLAFLLNIQLNWQEANQIKSIIVRKVDQALLVYDANMGNIDSFLNSAQAPLVLQELIKLKSLQINPQHYSILVYSVEQNSVTKEIKLKTLALDDHEGAEPLEIFCSGSHFEPIYSAERQSIKRVSEMRKNINRKIEAIQRIESNLAQNVLSSETELQTLHKESETKQLYFSLGQLWEFVQGLEGLEYHRDAFKASWPECKKNLLQYCSELFQKYKVVKSQYPVHLDDSKIENFLRQQVVPPYAQPAIFVKIDNPAPANIYVDPPYVAVAGNHRVFYPVNRQPDSNPILAKPYYGAPDSSGRAEVQPLAQPRRRSPPAVGYPVEGRPQQALAQSKLMSDLELYIAEKIKKLEKNNNDKKTEAKLEIAFAVQRILTNSNPRNTNLIKLGRVNALLKKHEPYASVWHSDDLETLLKKSIEHFTVLVDLESYIAEKIKKLEKNNNDEKAKAKLNIAVVLQSILNDSRMADAVKLRIINERLFPAHEQYTSGWHSDSLETLLKKARKFFGG